MKILYEQLQVEVNIPIRSVIEERKDIAVFTDTRTQEKINIYMCVDGSEQQIYKPSSSTLDSFHYSGKKSKHTFTKLLACSPRGKIYYLSQSFPGSVNDQAVYNQCNLHLKVPANYGIICDSGYAPVEGYPNVVVSLKKPPDRELTDTEVAYNNEIKKIRIVVENVFSQLKQWAICSDVLRLHVTLDGDAEHSHHRVWAIVSALHNLYGPDLRQAILEIEKYHHESILKYNGIF